MIRRLHRPATSSLRSALLLLPLILGLMACERGPELQPWHTAKLSEEFHADRLGRDVNSFQDYLALEERLFRQLDELVYARTPSGPEYNLQRYSRGSAAEPGRGGRDWNRSFELTSPTPRGGVLLLHGMSDSPYSLRAPGQALNRAGYRVLGLRLPGHGTAPSGLRKVKWEDMAAAAELAMAHLASALPDVPLHMIGYSTGAPLALHYTLEAMGDPGRTMPASLVLISPAIRIHPAGALAGVKNAVSVIPGLGGLAYLSVMAEFDPYKYNSFATNAGAQVHRITRAVDRRMAGLSADPGKAAVLPPMLVLKSTVDSTVSTEAVVDHLLKRLPVGGHELVLFDINRDPAIGNSLLVDDPGPLTRRLLADPALPFAVTFVTNAHPGSAQVVSRYRGARSPQLSAPRTLGLRWPADVASLSHVALSFPPDDPLYGRGPPADDGGVFLGDLPARGEHGLLRIPPDWLLRQRYNPFYDYLEGRILRWLADGGDSASP